MARPLPARFSAKVVGLTFEAGYPQNLHRLERHRSDGIAWELELVREPANPHDVNAVAVRVAADGEQLGHLPAFLAARLAPELDAGARWTIAGWDVLVVSRFGDRPGLGLDVRRLVSASLSQPAATLRLAS